MREDYSIFSAVTLLSTGFSASFPFLIVFLNQVKHVPVAQDGIVYIISGVFVLFGQLISGRLSDLLGTKTVALLGMVVSAIAYLSMSFFVATNGPVISFKISYPVVSLFSNLPQLSLSSYYSDKGREQMSKGLAMLYVGLNFGFTLGPVSGGIIIAYFGYIYVFAFGAITTAAAFVVALIGIRENPKFALRSDSRSPQSIDSGRPRKTIPALLILILASWFVISYQAAPLSLYESSFLSLSSIEVGLVLSTNGLLITVLQRPISHFISIEKRLRLSPVAVGSVVMAIGFTVVGVSRTFFPLEAAISITTLGEMMISVPTQVALTLFSGRKNRGRYQSFYFASSRAGSSISSYLGPLSFAFFTPFAFIGWYLVAAVSIVAAAGYLVLSPFLAKEYNRLVKEEIESPVEN